MHTLQFLLLISDKHSKLNNQIIVNLKQWGLGFSPFHTLASKQRGRKRVEGLMVCVAAVAVPGELLVAGGNRHGGEPPTAAEEGREGGQRHRKGFGSPSGSPAAQREARMEWGGGGAAAWREVTPAVHWEGGSEETKQTRRRGKAGERE